MCFTAPGGRGTAREASFAEQRASHRAAPAATAAAGVILLLATIFSWPVSAQSRALSAAETHSPVSQVYPLPGGPLLSSADHTPALVPHGPAGQHKTALRDTGILPTAVNAAETTDTFTELEAHRERTFLGVVPEDRAPAIGASGVRILERSDPSVRAFRGPPAAPDDSNSLFDITGARSRAALIDLIDSNVAPLSS